MAWFAVKAEATYAARSEEGRGINVQMIDEMSLIAPILHSIGSPGICLILLTVQFLYPPAGQRADERDNYSRAAFAAHAIVAQLCRSEPSLFGHSI